MQLKITTACGFENELPPGDLFINPATANAHSVIDSIVQQVGLSRNFTIVSAKIETGGATFTNGNRYIIYNPRLIELIQGSSAARWTALAILAHEVGHHLNGHFDKGGGSTPDREIEADEFSGFVVARLGGGRADAVRAVAGASVNGSNTHPMRRYRIEAVVAGWSHGATGRPAVTEQGIAIFSFVVAGKVLGKAVTNNVEFHRFPDGTWKEKANGQWVYFYNELQADAEYYTIEDNSRNMIFAVPTSGGTTQYWNGSDWVNWTHFSKVK
jgi:hypothetical protein